MRRMRRVALGLVAAASLGLCSNVHDLKTESFKDFVEEHDLVLAEFFTPWCGHCKTLAPKYEEAANTLQEQNIPLAKVDCAEEAGLCKEYGIEGYPTLNIFRGLNHSTPYPDALEASAIVSYMTKQALPAVSTVTSETIDEFKASNKIVAVAYFATEDQTSNDTFSKVADLLRSDVLFGASSDVGSANTEDIQPSNIVVYKDFDDDKDIFDAQFDITAITEFIKTASTPLVGEAGIPLAYIFYETPEQRTELVVEMKALARKHRGKINFATIDAIRFDAQAGNLNLESGKWPAFAIEDTVSNQRFAFTGSEISEKNIGKFVQDYIDGKFEPSIKSEL